MDDAASLDGKLLIAMPSLGDPNFMRSVVLLGTHSPDGGAFGLIINRPIDVPLSEILDELGLEPSAEGLPTVLAGGPVQPSHGFVVFEADAAQPGDDDMVLPNGIVISGNAETLAWLTRAGSGGRYSLALGYAGWFPGQLETEIEENSWLVAPMDSTILFDLPFEERWVAALDSIGVDPGTLVDSGSAAPA
jgi:putative transcriptional regulator